MSSVVDEDTARTINETRDTVFDLLGSAQTELKKVALAFFAAWLTTIISMRLYVWSFLESNTKSQLPVEVAETLDLVTRTPFDPILLQIKLGLLMGGIAAALMATYLGRKAIIRRVDARIPVNKYHIWGFVATSIALAILGIVYAYSVFFPNMFRFLAGQATQAGIKPSYGIVRYTEFLLLLTISFGIAAQLPLFMGALSYTELVPYETFRDKWRHAVVGMFVFGMVFSPPDPFTLIMWAIPLVFLYGVSLGIAKVITNINRASKTDATVDRSRYRRMALQTIGVFAVGVLATVGMLAAGFGPTVHELIPEQLSSPAALTSGSLLGWASLSLQVGAVLAAVVISVSVVRILREPVIPPLYTDVRASPEEIDLEELDATGVEMAPDAVFAELPEQEAARLASDAMDEEPEKAELILERWETVQKAQEDSEDDSEASTEEEAEGEGDSSLVEETAAGMIDPFTEDETTEDDIGGYFYDIQFILSSLRSRMFVIVGVFASVFLGLFTYLYARGIEDIVAQFTAQVPDEEFAPGEGQAPTESIDILIALHPVEVLIFIVKFSGLMATLVTLPVILYYAWPAVQQRGFVSGDGDRRGFLVWGGIILTAIIGGSLLGFLYVAPSVISYLITDAQQAGVVISYRIRNLLWIVFFLTIGIGLFISIPVTLGLFHFSGIIRFERLYETWRPTVLGMFVLAAVISPGSLLTMLLAMIPITIAYLLGIGLLWVLTFPSRLRDAKPQTS